MTETFLNWTNVGKLWKHLHVEGSPKSSLQFIRSTLPKFKIRNTKFTVSTRLAGEYSYTGYIF